MIQRIMTTIIWLWFSFRSPLTTCAQRKKNPPVLPLHTYGQRYPINHPHTSHKSPRQQNSPILFVACARPRYAVWHPQDMTHQNHRLEDQDQSIWSMLSAAHDAYSAEASTSYDEVLAEISIRIQSAQSIGKSDIGALLIWKRLRADTPWAKKLMNMPENKVRAATGNAYYAVNDPSLSAPKAASTGRSELSVLPGFGTSDALASALLLAAAPDRMAIYDRRAQSGLGGLSVCHSHRVREDMAVTWKSWRTFAFLRTRTDNRG